MSAERAVLYRWLRPLVVGDSGRNDSRLGFAGLSVAQRRLQRSGGRAASTDPLLRQQLWG